MANLAFSSQNYHSGTFSETQHFTQIVWKETSEMGIARQWNTTTNCVATVAMYRPSGNSNAPGKFYSSFSIIYESKAS